MKLLKMIIGGMLILSLTTAHATKSYPLAEEMSCGYVTASGVMGKNDKYVPSYQLVLSTSAKQCSDVGNMDAFHKYTQQWKRCGEHKTTLGSTDISVCYDQYKSVINKTWCGYSATQYPEKASLDTLQSAIDTAKAACCPKNSCSQTAWNWFNAEPLARFAACYPLKANTAEGLANCRAVVATFSVVHSPY